MRNQTTVCPSCDWKQPYYNTRCERCEAPLSEEAALEDAMSAEAEAPRHMSAREGGPKRTIYEHEGEERRDPRVVIYGDEPGWRGWLKARLLNVPEEVDRVEFIGRCALFVVLVVMGASALSMDIETGELATSKMHLIHLVFHEAGHVIFSLLGRFMATAGGTIMQLLMPAIVFGVFVFRHRNSYGGAVALWWIGHSCLDIAPYAHDARSQELILLGGVTGRDVPGYHDWNTMLRKLQWLEHDHTIAGLFWWGGAALLVGALGWGGYLLWRQSRNLEQAPEGL